jgi:hypothetical protein
MASETTVRFLKATPKYATKLAPVTNPTDSQRQSATDFEGLQRLVDIALVSNRSGDSPKHSWGPLKQKAATS